MHVLFVIFMIVAPKWYSRLAFDLWLGDHELEPG